MEKITPVYTKCPFCQTDRRSENEKTCHICGLKFDELDEASNVEAKKRSLSRKPFESLEDEIVYVKIPPKDVDVPTAKTLTVLFGLFGAGNFYVGKFFKAFIMLVMALAGIAVEISYYVTKLQLWLAIGTSILIIPTILWLFDIGTIFSGRFKYPVKLKTNIDVDKFYNLPKLTKGKK